MYQSIFRILEVDITDLFTSFSDTSIDFSDSVLMIIISFICGFLISFVYMHTSERQKFSKNFALTMVLLPAIISSIILLVGSDIARAFSLAGAFAIIRFRSEPGEPKDIAFVLFSMAAGLALGIGEYVFAILFTLILCLIMYVLSKTSYGNNKKLFKGLKITIPEDLNYEEEFNEVFEKHNVTYILKQVKTTSLGSLYQVYYDVTFSNDLKPQDLIDDLRVKNSNLDIVLSVKTV